MRRPPPHRRPHRRRVRGRDRRADPTPPAGERAGRAARARRRGRGPHPGAAAARGVAPARAPTRARGGAVLAAAVLPTPPRSLPDGPHQAVRARRRRRARPASTRPRSRASRCTTRSPRPAQAGVRLLGLDPFAVGGAGRPGSPPTVRPSSREALTYADAPAGRAARRRPGRWSRSRRWSTRSGTSGCSRREETAMGTRTRTHTTTTTTTRPPRPPRPGAARPRAAGRHRRAGRERARPRWSRRCAAR